MAPIFFLFAFPTAFLIGGVVMLQWKNVFYAGAGYLYGENGQRDDLNLKIAIKRGTMMVNWLSTRHELSGKAITFRLNAEINSSGHYVIQIEVYNDGRFRASGLTVDQLRRLINDDNNQKEIFGS